MLKTVLRALALFGLGAVALTMNPRQAEAAGCMPCVWAEYCTGEAAVYSCWFSCSAIPVGCTSGCGDGKYLLWCWNGPIW